MLSSIKNYFEDQINGVKFVDLFQQIASTITGEYINDIYISIEESGFPPLVWRYHAQSKYAHNWVDNEGWVDAW